MSYKKYFLLKKRFLIQISDGVKDVIPDYAIEFRQITLSSFNIIVSGKLVSNYHCKPFI